MKLCTNCKTEKPKEEFHKDSMHIDGLRSNCKSCVKKTNKKWKKTPNGKKWVERKMEKYRGSSVGQTVARKSHLKTKYGITLEDYDNMLESQGGGCGICGASVPGGRYVYGNLLVDHNHTNGEVRGLLCNPCNALLGYARDSVDILTKAIKYLGGI